MYRYTTQEKVDMLNIFYECNKNKRQSKLVYGERYPRRIQPSESQFVNVNKRFNETGSVVESGDQRIRRMTLSENKQLEILLHFQEDPSTSVREVARLCSVSVASTHKVLKLYDYKPFKYHKVQSLQESDYPRRTEFCNWFLTNNTNDSNFYRKILWTDESSFDNNTMCNLHNAHFWNTTNPKFKKQANFQVQFRTNVWCGIIDNILLGPYFYTGILNGNKYLRFLNCEFQNYWESLPLFLVRDMYFQQDGAPPHNCRPVHHFLNSMFNNKWIVTYGPIKWPARSPDLSPLDFFLWGHIKGIVYITPPRNLDDLQTKIKEACASISSATLAETTRSVISRTQKCILFNGNHIEHDM